MRRLYDAKTLAIYLIRRIGGELHLNDQCWNIRFTQWCLSIPTLIKSLTYAKINDLYGRNIMLTNDAIRTATEIRLYSGDLLSALSCEDHETYWFSKRGLPWEHAKTARSLEARIAPDRWYSD